MKPINFTESTLKLGAPKGQEKEIGDLHVYTDKKKCISCWEFTDEEIETLKKTKKIYVGVFSGKTQPPIFLTVDKPFLAEFTRYMEFVKKLGMSKRSLSQEEYQEYLKLLEKFQNKS